MPFLAFMRRRPSKRALETMYGPFPSRAAAKRYCDAVLDLFKLRRCMKTGSHIRSIRGAFRGDEEVSGAVQQACTAEEYTAEAEAVKAFFDTPGGEMLGRLAEREESRLRWSLSRRRRCTRSGRR